MSIQKKSLISTLKTAKKANVASSHDGEAKGSKVSSMRMMQNKSSIAPKAPMINLRRGITLKSTRMSNKKLVD